MTDLQTLTRSLDAIQGATFGTATKVLAMGKQAIDEANSIAGPTVGATLTQTFFPFLSDAYAGSLPGQTSRDTVAGKLDWHAQQIAASPGDDWTYPYWDDLKSWVKQAFIEDNASAEGRATFPSLFDQFGQSITELPKTIGYALGTAATGVAQGVGQGLGAFGAGLLQNPVGLLVLVGLGFVAVQAWQASR